MTTGRQYCGTCEGHYEFEVPAAGTPVSDLEAYFEAQEKAADAHREWHHANDEVHIRRQVNPRRVRTGNQFYRRADALGPAENGSQTLCGARPGPDMSWADTRHASQLAHVTCKDCKRIRTGGK